MTTLNQKKKRVEIDEELFSKIEYGDEKAFEELYYLTYKPLYAFVLSLTLNKEDAEDILQETYLKVRGACHLYQKQGNPMAWMMKIAKNLYLMKLRKENKVQPAALEDYHELVASDQISAIEDRVLLEEMFQAISREDRDIIIMHVMMGMKHKEIAKIVQMPIGTVLSRYHRAMKLLKKKASLIIGKEE